MKKVVLTFTFGLILFAKWVYFNPAEMVGEKMTRPLSSVDDGGLKSESDLLIANGGGLKPDPLIINGGGLKPDPVLNNGGGLKPDPHVTNDSGLKPNPLIANGGGLKPDPLIKGNDSLKPVNGSNDKLKALYERLFA
ncbi:hypothetical protein [Alteromonas sp. a30]|uniref:hypothetical protein n=1 Tax=Alteromonas sp. a30 TaxID=2730917 RepID=UPI00228310C8|nr:hypothetical protein [Alteromonas sp. a30]MCY7297407.1 hypothetical protein [Alteromonas sp. a30]